MAKVESIGTGRYEGVAERYRQDGYLSPMPIIDAAKAAGHRRRLEEAEAVFGPLNYQAKVHTILRSPLELATHPRVLDIVEALIGPNILLWTSTYIIKEPLAPVHVSWHQDLTYWGLSGDDQVSMWLALSPANETNGCMRLFPGSHLAGRRDHRTTKSESNLLFQGQTVGRRGRFTNRVLRAGARRSFLSSRMDAAFVPAEPERRAPHRIECPIRGHAYPPDEA